MVTIPFIPLRLYKRSIDSFACPDKRREKIERLSNVRKAPKKGKYVDLLI